MKLYVEVELGNDMMESARDAGAAINYSLLAQGSSMVQPLQENEGGVIRDDNGNCVGTWVVRP